MLETAPPRAEATPLDRGLRASCGIAAFYRIGADPVQLARELALGERMADETDLIRAARMVGLKARLVGKVTAERLATLPAPAIVRMTSGALMVFGGTNPSGLCRLVDPISHAAHESPLEEVASEIGGQALLVARSAGPAPSRASSACAGSCPPSGAIAVRSATCSRRRCSCRSSP
jgi:ATP-binding cassette, subfamily B, bacterial HlyB/CyaB